MTSFVQRFWYGAMLMPKSLRILVRHASLLFYAALPFLAHLLYFILNISLNTSVAMPTITIVLRIFAFTCIAYHTLHILEQRYVSISTTICAIARSKLFFIATWSVITILYTELKAPFAAGKENLFVAWWWFPNEQLPAPLSWYIGATIIFYLLVFLKPVGEFVITVIANEDISIMQAIKRFLAFSWEHNAISLGIATMYFAVSHLVSAGISFGITTMCLVISNFFAVSYSLIILSEFYEIVFFPLHIIAFTILYYEHKTPMKPELAHTIPNA